MEREFDTFTEDCRAAWTKFWEFYADAKAVTLPTSVLVRALPPTVKTELYWRYLRDALAQLQSRDALPEVVTIERQYGYGELR